MPILNRQRNSSGGAAAVGFTGGVTADSCIFNDADSPSLTMTPGGAGDTDDWSVMFEVKRSALGILQSLFAAQHSSGYQNEITFLATNALQMYMEDPTAANRMTWTTVDLFRDTTAWYNIIFTWAGDASKLFVNGVEVTAITKTVSPTSAGVTTGFNNAVAHYISRYAYNDTRHFDGYLTNVCFVDGAVTNTDFGTFDDDGRWAVKSEADLTTLVDAKGAESWYLPDGTDMQSGTDASNNSNDWTISNIVSADIVKDSPTNSEDGVSANYPVPNSQNGLGSGGTLADGNLSQSAGAGWHGYVSTLRIPVTGKWGFKVTINGAPSGSVDGYIGITSSESAGENSTGSLSPDTWPDTAIGISSVYDSNFVYQFEGGTATTHHNATAGSIDDNDVIEFLLDQDSHTLDIKIEGSAFGGQLTSVPTTEFSIFAGMYTLGCEWDFGQRGYSPSDSSYKVINSKTIADEIDSDITDPSKYFQVDTFTGTGSELARTLTNAAGGAFRPDMVWVKDRDSTVEHLVTDIARGVTKELNPDSNAVETTVAQGLKSFDSSGYTLGTDGNYNTSSSPNIAWCWRTQGGAGASNIDGALNTTTTSVGATPGFSISTYTGTGSATTIGHGLGAVPELIICKERTNDVGGWFVYHKDMTAAPETDYSYLDVTTITTDDATIWNDTAPTSTVFTVGTHDDINESSGTYVAYCWAGIPGFSHFGGYEGTGTVDGPVINCGFAPAWLLLKNIDAADSWTIWDTTRSPGNPANDYIQPEAAAAEVTGATANVLDILSNGFKLRGNDSRTNSAQTFIYAAFAGESPSILFASGQTRAR